MAKRAVKLSREDEDLAQSVMVTALQVLQGQVFLYERPYYRTLFTDIRSRYFPRDDRKFFYGDSFEYNNYDPTPLISMLRCVSGFLGFHYSMANNFFKLGAYKDSILDTGATEDFDVEKLQLLDDAVTDNHQVIQHPDNFQVVGKSVHNRVAFNVGGVVTEDDPLLVKRLINYEPENLALGSLDGKETNVWGVREMLTPIQARVRFPNNRLLDSLAVQADTFGEHHATDMYYRFNIPRPLLYMLFKAKLMENFDTPYMKKFFDSYFGIGMNYKMEGDDKWIDFWFCKRGILSAEIKDNRNIIISRLLPASESIHAGKGLGEISMPTQTLLTELEVINLTAYERTFTGAWAVSDESEALGINLGRDKFTYVDNVLQNAPKYLGTNAPMNIAIEVKNYIQARFDRNIFLDTFELINKSRMSKAETMIRNEEDFMKLSVFLPTDTAEFLNPLVLDINNAINKTPKGKERSEQLKDYNLRAYYISPVSEAHKMTYIEKGNRLLDLGERAIRLEQAATPLTDGIDVGEYYREIVKKTGELRLLRGADETTIRKEIRLEKEQIALDQAQAEATGRIAEIENEGSQSPAPKPEGAEG